MESGELILNARTPVCFGLIPILINPKLMIYDVEEDAGFHIEFKYSGKRAYLFRYLKLKAGKTNVFMWNATGKMSTQDQLVVDEFVIWGFSPMKIKYEWNFKALPLEHDYHLI